MVSLGEGRSRSAYDVVGEGRRLRIVFEIQGDGSHLPVSLASMTAKLVRELLMARFNRHWCAMMPELKPTAGYSTDGRRWLADASAGVPRETLEQLRRLA